MRILHERKITSFILKFVSSVLLVIVFAVFCKIGAFSSGDNVYALDKSELYVNAGVMYESGGVGKPNSLYFLMEKNELPYDKTDVSYKPTSIDAIKLVREGKILNIANVNVGVIFKLSSNLYEFILPPWKEGDVAFEDGDALIVEGEFYSGRTGYTLKISKTRITKTNGNFVFDYSFDENEDESEETSSSESLEDESESLSYESEEIESSPVSSESEEIESSSNGNESILESENGSSNEESEESSSTVESEESVSGGESENDINSESEMVSESDFKESENTSEPETESEIEDSTVQSESNSKEENAESESISEERESISKTESEESGFKSESEKLSDSQSVKKRGCALSLSLSITPLCGILLPLVLVFKRKSKKEE